MSMQERKSFFFLASTSVITPCGVDTIAIPRPLFIFGKLLALEKILLPGLEILSIVFITGFPELYFKLISIEGFLSSFIL